MKDLTLIVAVAENNSIGKGNQLLWHLPDDLKRFKQLTENHTIIMGMNTYQSLPRKPLPKRRHIILSGKQISIEGCLVVSSLKDALEACDEEKENFIIGGALVYKQFLPLAQKIQYTKVHASFEADAFFPKLDLQNWEAISQIFHSKDENHLYSFDFITYQRI